MTFAPEMNWVPARFPHEITDQEAGQKIVDNINEALKTIEEYSGVAIRAKLDSFHVNPDTDAPISWSIEICPVHYFHTEWLSTEKGEGGISSWTTFKNTLKWLFGWMRKEQKMVPSAKKKRKDGTLVQYPGGGCHINIGADLFPMSHRFYGQMERFHRNLAVDYANRPYLRWLFADWFSNIAHHSLWNPDSGPINKWLHANESREDFLFRTMIRGTHAIESRFMASNKGAHNTFEFRFFRMVEDPEELRLIALFTEAWVSHLTFSVYENKTIEFNLTKRRWAEFKNSRTVWAQHIAPFIKSLGLKPNDYRMFFERNYLTRLKFGKME